MVFLIKLFQIERFRMNYRNRDHVHRRSKVGSAVKNRKTKLRKMRNKKKLKSLLALAEKDAKIDKLHNELNFCKQKIKATNKRNATSVSSRYRTSSFISLSTRHPSKMIIPSNFHRSEKEVNHTRASIIKFLPGIPVFTSSDVSVEDTKIGAGQFGTIKIAYIKKLNLKTALKLLDSSRSTKQSVLAEAVVYLTLSGHPNFAFCFGMLNDNGILIEFFGAMIEGVYKSHPTLATYFNNLNKSLKRENQDLLKRIFIQLLDAFSFMHSKKILHNDIKADNVIITETVKIIDFGKATMVTDPIIYRIQDTKEQEIYNKRHRHLAYELRNITGSKQSIATDTYSIGYMLKHTAGIIYCNTLVKLGRLMKHKDVECRITIENAVDKISLI